MPRRPGTVSPSKAARLLGVHKNTVIDWCRKSLAGEFSPLEEVERDEGNGYFYIELTSVRALLAAREETVQSRVPKTSENSV